MTALTDVEVPAAPVRPTSRPAVVVGVPALVMLVVGTVGISNRQLWQDELATWWASTIPWADFQHLISQTDVVFVPYYLLIRGWVGIAGTSPLALRLPALVAMVLAAGLVAAVARRLFDQRVGLVAGLVFALFPAITRYAQEGRPYAMVIAGAAASTLLLLRATDRSLWPRWLAYGVVTALTLSLHILATPLLLAHAVWAWRRRQRLAFAVAAVPAAAPAIVLAVLAANQREQVDWIDTAWWSLGTMLGELLYSYFLPVAVIALMIAAVVRRRRSHPDAVALLAVWAWAPVVLLFAVRPVVDLFIARYLLFVLPAWAVLTAVGLVDAYGSVRRRWHFGLGWSIAGMVVLGLMAAPGHRDARTDPPWQPDFRSLAFTIRDRLQPGDAIAYQDSTWNERMSIAYYLPGPDAPRDVFLRTPHPLGTYGADECEQPEACLGDTRRIWFVTTAVDGELFAGVSPGKAQLLRDRFEITETYGAKLVRLALLTRR